MSTRRKFIARTSQFAALATQAEWLAAALLSGCTSLRKIPAEREPQGERKKLYDCLVLGAGIAGMTTARALRDLNRRHSILVLEGSDRVGGRMQTNRTDFAAPVELGAEYIHRAPGSVPLWNEVQRYGLQAIAVPKRTNALVFWEEGHARKLETMSAVSDEMGLGAIFDMLGLMLPNLGPDISGQAYMDRLSARGVDRTLVQMALNGHLPCHLSELSIDAYKSDDILGQLREPNDYSVKNGYDAIVTGMATGLEVRTGEQVAIVRRKPHGVEVETVNGVTYFARTAVITFSVNMLRSRTIRFEPQLPDSKLEAIEGIGMGDVAKTIIQFEQAFWPKEMTMLHLAGNGRAPAHTYFRPFFGRKGLPAVLTAYLVGETADKMRPHSDTQVLGKICHELDQVFPHAAPCFNKIARTSQGQMIYQRKHWANDPFAMGGYSFVKFNPRARTPVTQLRAALKDPNPTLPLFWAGEATSVLTQPSSVHGANSSGLEAASAVHSYLTR